jgi:hypothetical protein
MQLATLVQSIQIHDHMYVIEMARNYVSAMRPTYSKYLSEMIWIIAPVLQVHAHFADATVRLAGELLRARY